MTTHPTTGPEAARRHIAATTPRLTARKGSIAEAVQHYLRSDEWRALSEGTRRHRRPVLDDIVERYGRAALHTLEARHIRSDLRDLRGHAFNRRLKVWRGLMAYAAEQFDLRANPAADVAAKKLPGTEGHAQWTEADAANTRRTRRGADWPRLIAACAIGFSLGGIAAAALLILFL